jgi:CRP-like cAMP-binding protein
MLSARIAAQGEETMYIEKADLFHDMSPGFVDEIAANLIVESHAAGTILFRRGDPADYLFILEEGRVRLSVGEEGRVTHSVRNSGDAFGWSSLVEREQYSASAECLIPTKTLKIRTKKLSDMFSRDPASGLIFYKRLARLIGQRLEECYRMLPGAHGGKGGASAG